MTIIFNNLQLVHMSNFARKLSKVSQTIFLCVASWTESTDSNINKRYSEAICRSQLTTYYYFPIIFCIQQISNTRKFISCNFILKLKSILWYCRYELHFIKVAKFVFDFKCKSKFNLLKTYGRQNGIFDFQYLKSNLKNIKSFCTKKDVSDCAGILARVFQFPDDFELNHLIWNLKSKHKIYIMSKNVLLRICRPHSGK